jgi:hypothetical protein
MGYWNLQIADLVSAYLEFRARSDNEGLMTVPTEGNSEAMPPFTVRVLDIFCE